MNILKSLKMDTYYKIIMACSFGLIILIITGNTKLTYPNQTLIVLIGLFLVGLGEFINHPFRTEIIKDHNIIPDGILSGNPRQNLVIGWCFNIVGVIVIGFGVYNFV